MQIREDIFNELNAISTIVAGVPHVNVFSLADDYFTGIEPELKARISADSFYTQNAFSVPEGYFDGLAGNIMQKIKGADDTDNILPGIGSKNIFTVPQGYFAGLTAAVLGKIKHDQSISADTETAEISALVAGIGRKNIYAVPTGYFEKLNFSGEQKPVAKVVKMNPARAMFRYAAAAVITGLIGLSVINIANKTGNEVSVAAPAKIQYASNEAMASAKQIMQSGSFEKELNNLSDDDIDQYIKASGEDVNAALVASSMSDESKLPEATDYLLDENTLDNYLNDNNLRN